MKYETIFPPPNLTEYVRFFWVLESNEPYIHRSMADGCVEMIFHYSGTPFSKYVIQPSATGGKVTQSPYLIIDDDKIDEHYQKAVKYGAEILLDLLEKDYGGKDYTCKDPEGHIWSFGSYDPRKEES